MEITPNTPDVELDALSESRRSSESRRDTLERLANLCTPRSTSVSVRFVEDGASCVVDEETPGEAYEIRIPTRRYDQPGTDLPDAVWDKRVQVGLLFHELGHVRYSDFEHFGERMEEISPEWRPAFKTIYNAAEDGVVETQIANEFTVADDLAVLNETFVQLAERRHREFVELFDLGPDERDRDAAAETTHEHDGPWYEYTVLEGLKVGLLDRGFTQANRFDELVDPSTPTRTVRDDRGDVLRELSPALDEFMARMLSETDGTERVDLAYEFFQRVRRRLDPLPALQLRRLQPFAVRPEDVAEGEFGPSTTADALPSADAARAYVVDDAPEPTENGEHSNSDGAPEDADRSNLPPGHVAQRELKRRARRAARSSHGRVERSRSPLRSTADELRDVTRNSSTRVGRIGIAEEAPDGGDRDRWHDAVERARGLRADLETRLRRRRRTSFQGGYRSGRLDGTRLQRVVRGDDRVFERRTAGDDRDYSCVIVLDRSGSMADGPIETAEYAVAQLLSAFASVDVDIAVLSLFDSLPYLEVPMGGSPANHIGRFMHNEANGGTPLAETLATATSLVAQGEGAVPIVIVVTDGRPNDPGAYRRELERCSFPVYGLYIGTDTDDHSRYFDHVVSTDVESVDRDLRQLARSLFRGER